MSLSREKVIIKDVKYVLCRQIQKGVRCDDLTAAQKRLISCAYSKYGNREFTVEDCARLLNQQTSTTYFHLNNLAEKEIIAQRGKVGQMNQYSVLVTPQSNPECFLKETASNSTVSSGVKEAAVPRVAAAM